jgi:hypothetical protein
MSFVSHNNNIINPAYLPTLQTLPKNIRLVIPPKVNIPVKVITNLGVKNTQKQENPSTAPLPAWNNPSTKPLVAFQGRPITTSSAPSVLSEESSTKPLVAFQGRPITTSRPPPRPPSRPISIPPPITTSSAPSVLSEESSNENKISVQRPLTIDEVAKLQSAGYRNLNTLQSQEVLSKIKKPFIRQNQAELEARKLEEDKKTIYTEELIKTGKSSIPLTTAEFKKLEELSNDPNMEYIKNIKDLAKLREILYKNNPAASIYI